MMVAASIWWYWPRGDSRFVGTWKGYIVRGAETIDAEQEWEFAAHGWAYLRHGQSQMRSSMRWSIEGDQLILGVDFPAMNYGFQHWIMRIWNRLSGVAKPVRQEILSVTPEEIRTRAVTRPDAGVFIMRRVAE
jgi:hypothetical protein